MIVPSCPLPNRQVSQHHGVLGEQGGPPDLVAIRGNSAWPADAFCYVLLRDDDHLQERHPIRTPVIREEALVEIVSRRDAVFGYVKAMTKPLRPGKGGGG
jgi:hypothetical protein